jgi:hypothetical protein
MQRHLKNVAQVRQESVEPKTDSRSNVARLQDSVKSSPDRRSNYVSRRLQQDILFSDDDSADGEAGRDMVREDTHLELTLTSPIFRIMMMMLTISTSLAVVAMLVTMTVTMATSPTAIMTTASLAAPMTMTPLLAMTTSTPTTEMKAAKPKYGVCVLRCALLNTSITLLNRFWTQRQPGVRANKACPCCPAGSGTR